MEAFLGSKCKNLMIWDEVFLQKAFYNSKMEIGRFDPELECIFFYKRAVKNMKKGQHTDATSKCNLLASL